MMSFYSITHIFSNCVTSLLREKVVWLYVLSEKTILFKSYSNPGNFVIGNSTIANKFLHRVNFDHGFISNRRRSTTTKYILWRNYPKKRNQPRVNHRLFYYFLSGIIRLHSRKALWFKLYYLTLTMNSLIFEIVFTRILKFNCWGKIWLWWHTQYGES